MKAAASFAILLVIVSLGAVLRLSYLGTESFWYDEAYCLAEASDFDGIVTGENVGSDAPLFLLMVHAADRGPVNEWRLRLLPAFFGILTIPAVFMVARMLLNTKAGLIAAACAAMSPFYVYYAQELRVYTLVGFLACGGMMSLYRALERGGWKWWTAYGVFAALGLYAHYFGFFTLAAGGVYYLFFSGVVRRRLVAFVIANVAVLLAYAPWVPILLGRVGDVGGHYITPEFRWKLVPLSLKIFAVGHHAIPKPLWAACLAVFSLLLVAGLFGWRDRRKEIGLLACYGGVPMLLALVFALSGTNVFVHRYLFGASVALLILVAGCLSRARRVVAFPAGALLVAGALVSLGTLYDNGPMQELMIFRKKPFREMVAYVEDSERAPNPEDDVIVHFDRSSFLPFCVYSKRKLRGRNVLLKKEGAEPALPSYRDVDTKAVTLDEAIESADGVWLVVSSWTDDNTDAKNVSFDGPGRKRLLDLVADHPRLKETDVRYENSRFPHTIIRYFKVRPEPIKGTK